MNTPRQAERIETILVTVLFLMLLIPVLAFGYQALAPAPVEAVDYATCQVHAASQADVGRCIELHKD